MNKFYKISEKQAKDDDMIELYQNIVLPKRGTKHSAGYDFYLLEDISLLPGQSIKTPTGIKVELDEDKFLMVVPRSSLGFKYKLILDNTVGIIDSDYYNNSKNEGHIWVSMTNMSNKVVNLEKGQAFCQGIILNYNIVEDDKTETIRKGGFGSTDNKKKEE